MIDKQKMELMNLRKRVEEQRKIIKQQQEELERLKRGASDVHCSQQR